MDYKFTYSISTHDDRTSYITYNITNNNDFDKMIKHFKKEYQLLKNCGYKVKEITCTFKGYEEEK